MNEIDQDKDGVINLYEFIDWQAKYYDEGEASANPRD